MPRHGETPTGQPSGGSGRSEQDPRIPARPRDPQTVAVLADRFHMQPDALIIKINEAIQDFRSLAVPGGATVEVWVHAGDAVFSCYRFDSRAVLTLYPHGQERRTQVPTFVIDGGSCSSSSTTIDSHRRPERTRTRGAGTLKAQDVTLLVNDISQGFFARAARSQADRLGH